MTDYINKAFTGTIALALIVIAIGLIPISREKQLSNLCREYYAILKSKNDYSLQEKRVNIKIIVNKNRSQC